MQYVMLFYQTERWANLPASEKNRVHAACGAWHDEFVRSGQSRSAHGLQPPSTATTLSAQNGRTILSDGPFMETKEVLGGFEVFECKDLDEALAIAKRFPALEAGCVVEVRPAVTGPCED